ncbi:hypothetical protein [Bartonella mastomydis]|uniref:hypothetical protein n=1 Tax=Bartonella mastomydis TaxID=1820002 RepID=UPI001116264C|nr:hypothetical protein [Bartonella mastomydis]
MEKKYELTDETIKVDDHILHRIRALRNFGDIKTGDLGGWIEKEDNLSHEGNCWVGDNARVHGQAQIFGDAMVNGNAKVSGDAKVFNKAWVFGNAKIFDEALVFEEAKVFGRANVYHKAWLRGKTAIFGRTEIFALMSGNNIICDSDQVPRNTEESGNNTV